MLSSRLETHGARRPVQSLSTEAFAYLNHLRFVAMGCRSKRHTDLFEACALLHVDRNASRDAHADALMRCLNDTLGKKARLYAPGSMDLTFDERWLVELGRAIARSDNASESFLLKSRVSHEHRRLIRFLVKRISDCFSLT